MNKELAELIGIILGDGFLDNAQKHYRIGIAGDPINDKAYFEHIKLLIKKVWDKEVNILRRGRGIYLIINSKQIFLELVNKYRIPVGEGKSEKIVIPEIIAQDWDLVRHTLRGIVDTDGSIFVADKSGSPHYPSIEITTNSIALANQIKLLLTMKGFRVANIWHYKSKKEGAKLTYKVPLNGYENVDLWLKHIGFSNPVKRAKAENVIVNKILKSSQN